MGFEKLSVYCPCMECRHVLSVTTLSCSCVPTNVKLEYKSNRIQEYIAFQLYMNMSIINLINIKYLNRNLKMMHVGTMIENNQYLTVSILDFS